MKISWTFLISISIAGRIRNNTNKRNEKKYHTRKNSFDFSCIYCFVFAGSLALSVLFFCLLLLGQFVLLPIHSQHYYILLFTGLNVLSDWLAYMCAVYVYTFNKYSFGHICLVHSAIIRLYHVFFFVHFISLRSMCRRIIYVRFSREKSFPSHTHTHRHTQLCSQFFSLLTRIYHGAITWNQMMHQAIL